MSIFTKLFDTAVGIFKGIKDGAKITHILGGIYSNLDQIILGLVQVGGANTEMKVREAWQEFRNRFGTEVGAYDISKDIPQDVEEKMTNGLAGFGECMTLWMIGHYGSKPTPEEFNAVMRSMTAPGTFLTSPEPEPAPERELKDGEYYNDDGIVSPCVFDVGLSATLRTMNRNPETLGLDLKIKTLTKAIMQLGDLSE